MSGYTRGGQGRTRGNGAALQESHDGAVDNERGVAMLLHRLLEVRQHELAKVHHRCQVGGDGLFPEIKFISEGGNDSSCHQLGQFGRRGALDGVSGVCRADRGERT